MDDAVRELAHEAGIASDWIDSADRPQRVGIDTLRAVLTALGYACGTPADITASRARVSRADPRALVTATAGTPITLPMAGESMTAELVLENGTTVPLGLDAREGATVVPPIHEIGYHRLRCGGREIALAIAPARCVTTGDVAPGERMYGLAVQLYALRRRHDLGFGDAGALSEFVAGAARAGAHAVALSPTHSLFAADPYHYGPYSPSSRLFLNPLYADPALALGTERPATAAQETDGLIDWPTAARAKYAQLRDLFEDFVKDENGAAARDFASFVRAGGDRLREHALFEALHRHWLAASDPKWHWRDWPADWRAPSGAAVGRFAAAEARTISFHMFLQWLAARSLAAVQHQAREAGMHIGLIADVAIGMSPGGSHAWSRQQDLLPDLSVGAPPDPFNMRGQDWGLTTFSPRALTASGFEPFLVTLRAAMRQAGGVRIDHVMGLARLWIVPRGAAPAEGAYLSYPVDDLLRLLALESHRHRAIVIGEDLGTVEPQFRQRLARAGIAGMDVLWFQRDRKGFLAPDEWRRDAVAMTSTHDLPTVAGWWSGADIATRAALGLADEACEPKARARDRAALWRAFRKAGVVATARPRSTEATPAVDAAIDFTARSPSRLALIPIEDVLGLTDQPNVPGTVDEHPNWRRRLDRPVAEIFDAPDVQARLARLRGRDR